MHFVAIGNAFDGITMVGPFGSVEEAIEWSERHSNEWRIVTPKTPEEWEAE